MEDILNWVLNVTDGLSKRWTRFNESGLWILWEDKPKWMTVTKWEGEEFCMEVRVCERERVILGRPARSASTNTWPYGPTDKIPHTNTTPSVWEREKAECGTASKSHNHFINNIQTSATFFLLYTTSTTEI